ncbi:hypothetical protein B5F07_21680 [Lachnoclostridium sp. An169]|mgnify:CR=1 FL=1|uniref:uridine kinase family protein n=1 Tax=Lachnoclostridium sp. An169 TaxID=1965569 RepID=UPI000B377668|nr:hypothetical protein [Lachnoclostridium sp. An169]OUP79672.1 hypothetical protein B5F07_21680 [Lachnoclostridium sp. An169]
MKKQIVIGVSGGSGSGKTHFCREFAKMSERKTAIIHADHYFKKELPKMISPLTQKEYDDWNSPESLNYENLLSDVRTAAAEESGVILVEGAYIFIYKELREMMDLKIFVDTDIDLRLYRRIKRNMELFHMEMDEIAEYFTESAKFQEEIYSAPTKIYADLIFNGAKSFDIPVRMVQAYIDSILGF